MKDIVMNEYFFMDFQYFNILYFQFVYDFNSLAFLFILNFNIEESIKVKYT
jgi:hypothetical protein